MLSEKQIRLIWVLARQLDMDSEQLHALIANTVGRSSIKDLSTQQGREVIDALLQRGGKIKQPEKSRKDLPANVVELVTRAQMRFIHYLTKQLNWEDNPNRLKGFYRRIIKRDRISTRKEAIKVIQGLKSMVDRARDAKVKNS